MTIRVCVAGATGWAGSALCRAIARESDLQLVGAVARTTAGRSLGDALDDSALDLLVSSSVEEALATPTDVLVEYTRADSALAHVLAAIDRGVHVVIGSSGLTPQNFVAIDRAAREQGVGVIAVGNFAITAALLQKFATEAARYLSQWEIIDYASSHKIDAPSGTARELASRLAEVGTPRRDVPLELTIGQQEMRGGVLEGSTIHSVRLPGHVIGLEIIFGGEDERLSIRYEGGSGSSPYVGGALLAIREVMTRTGLLRGLDRIMTK